jgi:hypothetical protein
MMISVRSRRAVTLIEMLVSLISAGVVLGAAGLLLATMAEDLRNASAWREHYYSRGRANMEILWTMRQVPRRGLRQGEYGGGSVSAAQTVSLKDGLGPRGVITYVRDLYTQTDAGPLANDRSATGIIFKYYSVVYRFECDFAAAAGLGIPPLAAYPSPAGFNAMGSGQLKAWIESPGRISRCEILAVSVDTFDVTYVRDFPPPSDLGYAVQWSLNVAR